MFSEESEERVAREAALREEREERGLSLRDTRDRVTKYDRLVKNKKTKNIKDKKLRRFIKESDGQHKRAAKKAARSELLLQEEPGYLEAEQMERTYRFKQEDIAAAVPLASSVQYFDLKLDTFGPYSINYSRNGSHLLLGGQKGHLATVGWKEKKLGAEFHVRETVRDVQFLHNEMMYAVAQKRHVYVYDTSGMELHCLKALREVNKLAFLPYHFLLVAASDHGNLNYVDTSTGRPITEHRTKMGSLRCMAHNPHNGIVHLGHQNGTVTLWSPNMHTSLVKLLCHQAPLTAIAIETGGWYMATAGMDARLKIWDIRNYKELHSYQTYRPAVSLSVSQRGQLAMGRGRVVEVWRGVLGGVVKQSGPYMTHSVNGEVNDVEFCPFEDCLGIGHSSGFTSIIVPGCGEANFDALEANPYQTKKQRQEGEVKQLLEKIPSELIALDPDTISRVNPGPTEEGSQESTGRGGVKEKRKTRGRSSLSKKLHKKRGRKDAIATELKRKMQVEETNEETKDLNNTTPHKHVLDRFR
ncbi:uncharacterized protein LOC135342363 [Halichondria panicea]|uniref:uncharacterized protein LOC135342363 n=1 Tax=Halichondria panicea TaxID=6063 RepID=UPI00312B55AC